MSVRVPATSANLGPGFDSMGLALSMYAEVGVVGDEPPPEDAHVAEATHPAQVAFSRAGGEGTVWVRNTIPMGRGLGFSGAVRVGGIVAAEVQRSAGTWSRESSDALALGTELEGHADNVAPSLFGGAVIVSEGRVVSLPVRLESSFVVWIPSFTTSTNESRRLIGGNVPLDAAVFNIAHAAMLATAFATGDHSLLAEATRDRIHQDVRFEGTPLSREARDLGVQAGAWCGWLSGSGPTVALMCDPSVAKTVAAALPGEGHARILRLDTEGTVVSPPVR